MKKKIQSKAALHEQALKLGATVTDDKGKNFNSAKKKAAKRPKPEDPPKKLEKAVKPEKPVPPLNPEAPDKGSMMVAQSLEQMSKANAMMMAELIQQISAIKLNTAQPITGWEFDFIRDKNKNLEKIIASAKADKRIIN